MKAAVRSYAAAAFALIFVTLSSASPAPVYGQSKTDEDLFTLHVIQDIYFTWPDGSNGTDALVARLRRIDATLSKLKAAAVVRKADDNIVGVIDDCRSRVSVYEQYLRTIGAIKNDTVITANEDAGASVRTAFKLGVTAGDIASKSGYTDNQSVGTAAVVAFGSALFDSYMRAQERAANEKARIEAATNSLNRACNDLMNQSKARTEKIVSLKRWAIGEAGVDGFTAANWGEIIKRRPRDLFAQVRQAAIRVDNETSEAALNDAEVCFTAFQRAPTGSAYDESRALFLGTSADIATHAAVIDLKDFSYSNGPSKHSKRAIKIVEDYLALPEADKSFGNYHLARARAAAKDVSGALAAANQVAEPYRDTRFKYVYAKLASMNGQPEQSLGWLRSAFQSGHQMVSHTKTSADFKILREKLPDEFAELTKVKFAWQIDWGYRLTDDTITVTNNSAFPITNVVLTPTITSSGYNDWTRQLTCDRIDPGNTATWKLGVSGITSRGDDYKGKAGIKCDQSE